MIEIAKRQRHVRCRLFFACILLLVSCATGLHCSVAEQSAPPLRRAIITPANVEYSLSAVIALVPRPVTCGQALVLLCSGVLIDKRVVLTAAHCFDRLPASNQEVFLGANLARPAEGRFVPIAQVKIHPGYKPDTNENDLALVLLAASVEHKPVQVNTADLDPKFVSTSVLLSGFGPTTPGEASDGKRLAGFARVDSVGENDFRVVPGPGMSCVGDSGGPVFAEQQGALLLVGITSWGDPGCVEFGVNMRVDRYWKGFIEPYLASVESQQLREPIDPDRDYCSESCNEDADCPALMHCVASSGRQKRCVLGSNPPGKFGAECSASKGCSCTPCTPLTVDGRRGCYCFEPCADETCVDTPGTPGTPPVTVEQVTLAGGGGCSLPGGGENSSFSWVFLTLWLIIRRLDNRPFRRENRNKCH